MTATSVMSVDCRGDHCVIRLSGDVDIAAVAQLVDLGEAMIQSTAASRIEVDLAGVGFMDSLGIGAMVTLRNSARQRGLSFRVMSASPQICRVLEIAGVSGVLRLSAEAGP